MPDPGTPLCGHADFISGPFADLASGCDQSYVETVLLEATRQCEDVAGRRLAPFTITETLRAEGIDPDEYGGAANVPMSIASSLGMSYAQAIGGQDLVRHCWLSQTAGKYTDMWAYSDFSVTIVRSYGGTQDVPLTAILNGPEPDTGHVWFQLGTFLPVGSRIRVTYTAGYDPVPASLVRACRYMAAYDIVRELNPASTQHDPEQLHADALLILDYWSQP